ncbi:MAG: shikimate kinase [Oscillospiraceae bacterium]|nr:shikimate kinase [Oscillospiraceae bacterium]
MPRCGLLGKTLGHSYSPAIHRLLGSYSYELFETSEASLGSFLKTGPFDGLNVTIPYKKAVLPYCAALSPAARAIGSVNTLLRRPDGSLYGDNTDWRGFLYMVSCLSLDAAGKKALVLGSGGASLAVIYALRQLSAREIVVISRTGANNYGNLDRHRDADLIVNTTPLGMYPHNGAQALHPGDFPRLRGVLDLVYNPARTALLLEAERLGIPCLGGLPMLVSQAKASAELFTGAAIPDGRVEEIRCSLSRSMENVVLIGMPGSGKTAVGRAVAAGLGRPFADADEALTVRAGMPIPDYFAKFGEPAFRDLEHAVLAELGKASGTVIATGGGCVLREENYDSLHQNGKIFWLRRDVSLLPRDGRPLSRGADLAAMYAARAPRYARFADEIIENCAAVEDAAYAVKERL